MSAPANLEQTLEARARLARQQQHEQGVRQLKQFMKADDLDIGRTYQEILEEIIVLAHAELAALAPDPAPVSQPDETTAPEETTP